MIPVVGEGFPLVAALALGDLVFVVREEQVDASGVEVDGLAKVLFAHRAALDVPARAALAPRRGPEVVPVLGLASLPEREVGAVLLLVGVVALGLAGEGGADAQLALLHAGEGAVSRKGRHLEVDRAVIGAVGVAAFFERGDHVDLLGDVAGGGGLDVRREAVERGAVGVELVGPLFGDLGQGAAFLARAADGLVVHVGEVADVLHLVLAELEFEEAAQEVVHHEGAEVADVGGRVDGRAAVVEAVDAVGLRGAQFLGFAGEGVEKADGHD